MFKAYDSGRLATMPLKGSQRAAGYDFFLMEDTIIRTGVVTSIHTNICVNLPPGYYGQLLCKSRLAGLGIVILGGVIDNDYTGEIVILATALMEPRSFKAHAKIAQIVLIPYFTGDDSTSGHERGAGGFGSTGQ